MERTRVTSLINNEKFCINKGEEDEVHRNENIYVLSDYGLVHASIVEIFEDQSICRADKENTVKINDIVLTD